MDYVAAAANLYAQIYKMKGTGDRPSIRRILDGVTVPPFALKSSVPDPEMEEEEKECDESGEQPCRYWLIASWASF